MNPLFLTFPTIVPNLIFLSWQLTGNTFKIHQDHKHSHQRWRSQASPDYCHLTPRLQQQLPVDLPVCTSPIPSLHQCPQQPVTLTLLLKTVQLFLTRLWVKAKFPTMVYKVPTWLDHHAHLQPRWTYAPKRPGARGLGFCTGRSLCLEYFPRCPPSPPPDCYWNITFPRGLPWSPSKTGTVANTSHPLSLLCFFL